MGRACRHATKNRDGDENADDDDHHDDDDHDHDHDDRNRRLSDLRTSRHTGSRGGLAPQLFSMDNSNPPIKHSQETS